MKRIFCMLMTVLLCAFAFCGCRETAQTDSGHTARLTASASQMMEAVSADAQFANAAFMTDADADAELVLVFNYGIEDETYLAAIEDYCVSTIRTNESPCYFSAVRFREGTDASVISAVGETMKNSYAAYVVDQMVKYNGEKAALAESYTLYTYENAVVLFVCDGEADTVLSVLDGLCK